ncbi:MAG: hypothetical protein LBU24_04770 [Methanocalculaceae archaeon]|jgi:hypothetical protein|nr:hypothetical protein [Methanocalculaceae archaeon]
MSDSDNLGTFFGKIRSAGARARLFSWKKICDAAAAAEEAYTDLAETLAVTQQKLVETENLATSREAEIGSLSTRLAEAKSCNDDLHGDMDSLSEDRQILEDRLSKMTKTASANANSAEQWKAAEGARRAELAAVHDMYKELSAIRVSLCTERDNLAVDLAAERSAHLADNDQARIFRDQYLSRELEIDGLRKDLDASIKKIAAQQVEIDGYVEERDVKYAALAIEAERLNTLAAKLEEERKATELSARQNLVEIFADHPNRVGAILEKVCADLNLDLKTETTYKGRSHPNFAVLVNSSYVFFNTAVPASLDAAAFFEEHVAEMATELFEAAKEDGVRSEAYLVVPNAIAAKLTELVYVSYRCTVFVVTPEALEAIVRTLKRIEEYEFTRQITPFELDQICRFIGKLSHMTKRKIVLDTYFSNEMLEILQMVENLPTDVAADAAVYEREVRMNPPAERDTAVLTVPSLSAKVQKLEKAMLVRAATEAREVSEKSELAEK